MRAGRHTRRPPTHGVAGALLTTGVLTVALLATAVLATSASAPAALTRVTTPQVIAPSPGQSARPHRAGRPAAAPGWRVVQKIGPYDQSVSGQLSVHSAGDGWSVWTGTRFAVVDRLTGTTWARVPLPARFSAYVRSAVAFDGDSARDFWLFSSYRPAQALHFTRARWVLAPVPSWVLRKPAGGGSRSAVAAAFGPGNVWVFSLGAGSYAAHYDGHSWTKVRLPGTPDDVSAVSADDIWALAGRTAMHWTGRAWTTSTLPAAAGKAAQSFAELTATGPKSAWAVRTIGTPTTKAGSRVLHWNGVRWQVAAGAPATIVDQLVPDGSGGVWATGLNLDPSGFTLFFHLAGGRWTQVSTPAGIFSQFGVDLAWVPGTRSLWGAAAGLSNAGNYGVFIKDGA